MTVGSASSVVPPRTRAQWVDDRLRDAPIFYATFGVVTVVSALAVLIPGLPLIPVLVLTQVLNAILLLPLLAFMLAISRDVTAILDDAQADLDRSLGAEAAAQLDEQTGMVWNHSDLRGFGPAVERALAEDP